MVSNQFANFFFSIILGHCDFSKLCLYFVISMFIIFLISLELINIFGFLNFYQYELIVYLSCSALGILVKTEAYTVERM